MARERKNLHKVQMTDGKRQIIQQLIQEYDVETAEDIDRGVRTFSWTCCLGSPKKCPHPLIFLNPINALYYKGL